MVNQKSIKYILSLIAMSALTAAPSLACTDFLIKAKDGTSVVGRSMEWGADLQSRVCLHPRDESRSSTSPSGSPGVSWKSKYGYLGLDANKMPLTVDGMNEKGLSLGLLWMPGAVYQDVPSNASAALSVVDIGDWVLGNFTSVDEVKTAIAKLQVWAPQMKEWGGTPTAHLAIHDAQGKSIVIEFVNGQQKIYDNPLHVLTNAPTFDWHTTNLRNYISLSSTNSAPVQINGTVLAPPGQGGGFLGIPGDWTPPSRFVRTNAMIAFSRTANNAIDGVNLAQHVLNAVDIPLGDIRQKSGETTYCDYTQWIVIKDLNNCVLYFRSYDNLTLRQINLKNLNFDASEKSHVLVPVAGGNPVIDITPTLSK